jgi:hypothetical protein
LERPRRIDAEIEAAIVAMRAFRVKDTKLQEEVVRAYTRAAVEAAERARQEYFQSRAQLNNKPTAIAPALTGNEPIAEETCRANSPLVMIVLPLRGPGPSQWQPAWSRPLNAFAKKKFRRRADRLVRDSSGGRSP